MEQIRPYLPIIIGLSAAIVFYLSFVWLLSIARTRDTGDRLARFTGVEEDTGPEAEVGSEVYKLRLAFAQRGINVAGQEEIALWGARVLLAGACALVIWWMGFPPLTIAIGPVIAWMVINGYVEGAWNQMRRGIEREIPNFLSRMGSTVQAEPNVLNALESVALSLEAGGPLQGWLRRFVARLQTAGKPALRTMLEEAEAISPSLGLAIYEIGSLWETGGEGYVQAFSRAAENLEDILEAGDTAEAKGAGARGAVRVMLIALIGVTAVMMRNPRMAASMHSPTVQIAYMATAVLVVFGWFQINSMIEEVTQ